MCLGCSGVSGGVGCGCVCVGGGGGGVGGGGVRTFPTCLWGTPTLHKEGINVARVPTNAKLFLAVNSYPGVILITIIPSVPFKRD